jgi:hypothetical protein
MTHHDATPQPLWLAIEEKILALGSSDVGEGERETTIHRIAEELDGEGYNVSRNGGNMLALRDAVAARAQVGRPLMQDFNAALEALTLEDVENPLRAAITIATNIGGDFPRLAAADRRPDILTIVNAARLELLVAQAKTLSGDKAIRYLIAEDIDDATIVEALGVTEEQLTKVHATLEAERAAAARVEELLEAVAGQPDAARAEHLMKHDVSEELIVELAGIDQSVIDSVKEAMAEAEREQQRLAEEEAARKKAEAEGPALEDIPADELEDYVDEIKEILEFSDVESEIRSMCEASNIPKALVDLAVTDPDKLDELVG